MNDVVDRWGNTVSLLLLQCTHGCAPPIPPLRIPPHARTHTHARTIKGIARQRANGSRGTAREKLARKGGRRGIVGPEQDLDGFVETNSQTRVRGLAQPSRVDTLPQGGDSLVARHLADRAKHAQRAIVLG